MGTHLLPLDWGPHRPGGPCPCGRHARGPGQNRSPQVYHLRLSQVTESPILKGGVGTESDPGTRTEVTMRARWRSR